MPKQRFEIDPADRTWFERIGWRSVDDVLACNFNDVAAVSHSSDVVRVPIDSALNGPKFVFIKRYFYRRRSQRIRQMFRGTLFGKSRARAEFEFLTQMRNRHVPAVRPIAFGDRRRAAFLTASFVITEGAPDVQSLDLFALDRIGRRALGRLDRKALIQGLAETIRDMHRAGVKHGGLYWRNILVGHRADGSFRFTLLDPDTQGRLCSSGIPDADAIADLSQFVASAMAVGLRSGLPALMKVYFDVPRLSVMHRQFLGKIIERAQALAPGERRRIAMAESIEWLRTRIASMPQRSTRIRAIDSLDQFFDVLTCSIVDPRRLPDGRRTIHFSFSGESKQTGRYERFVIAEHGRFSLHTAAQSKPDLVIRSDPRTWLAIILGQPDAFARVRSGRLHLHGDTTLLPAIVEAIDGPSAA